MPRYFNPCPNCDQSGYIIRRSKFPDVPCQVYCFLCSFDKMVVPAYEDRCEICSKRIECLLFERLKQ